MGGGLGRTPIIGKTIREFLPREHLLSYLEAILRVYNQEGRRDNIYKARIKILVKAQGHGGVPQAAWKPSGNRSANPALKLELAEIERVRASSGRRRTRSWPTSMSHGTGSAADFKAWYRYNTRPHKVPGYRARDRFAEGPRRSARRHHRRADGRGWPTWPIAYPAASCAPRTTRTWCSARCGRSTWCETWQALQGAEPGDAQHRHADRHDLLPRARFLLAWPMPAPSASPSRSTSASTISIISTTWATSRSRCPAA